LDFSASTKSIVKIASRRAINTLQMLSPCTLFCEQYKILDCDPEYAKD